MKKKLCGAFVQSTILGNVTCANEKPCLTHSKKGKGTSCVVDTSYFYIDGENYYWALLCDCTEGDPLICGVYPSLKEAKECAHDVKNCPAKHKIKKCKIRIFL